MEAIQTSSDDGRNTVLASLMAFSLAQATVAEPSFAFLRGDELLRLCEKRDPACYAYIQGAFDSMTAVLEGAQPDNPLCTPKDFSTVDAVSTVISYLVAHPEKKRFSAASDAVLALLPLVTCKK